MAQLFPRTANTLAKASIVVGIVFLATAGGVAYSLDKGPYTTNQNIVRDQPVPFSHEHHVKGLGIDCRYCHTSVEDSHFANIPPTATCINCHQEMWHGSDLLAPVRTSFQTDKPIVWNRVHNVPHYAYFNHSIHVAKGVGCQSCHGQIDEMNLTFQAKTLLMEWCINCHRNPHEQIRPRSEVYSMTWAPGRPVNGKAQVWVREDLPHWGKNPDGTDNAEILDRYLGADRKGLPRPTTQAALGAELVKLHDIRDGVTLTSCSMCHR